MKETSAPATNPDPVDVPQAGENIWVYGFAIENTVAEGELSIGNGVFLVRDELGGRHIVRRELPLGISWRAISQRGEYPSGNTEDARTRAIAQAKEAYNLN